MVTSAMGTGLHPTGVGGLSPHNSGPAGTACEHGRFPSCSAGLPGSAGAWADPGPTPLSDRELRVTWVGVSRATVGWVHDHMPVRRSLIVSKGCTRN